MNAISLSTDLENSLSGNKVDFAGAHPLPSEPHHIQHASLIPNGQSLRPLPEKLLWPPGPLLSKHPGQRVRKFIPLGISLRSGAWYINTPSITLQDDYGVCDLHWLLVCGPVKLRYW